MKGLLLLSGGFDSPVAGNIVKLNGYKVGAVHFSYEPFTDNSPELKSKKLAKMLGFKEFISVNIGKEIEKIANQADIRYYFVLSKRLMYKKAEKIAKKKGYDFLITGDNLGQVSSQTLSNLSAIHRAVEIPVVRPLLTFDKQEIIALAREFGTYELSIGPEVCDVLGPKHPKTKVKYERVLIEEAKVKS